MFLIIGDLHLTDRARDAYRLGIFNWIRKQQIRLQPEATIILGDITDQKDRHSSVLVNSIVEGLRMLKPPVYILKGNHDYIDPNNPYFKFLNHLAGNMWFLTNVTEVEHGSRRIAFIPHTRSNSDFDAWCSNLSSPPYLVVAHQTFEGAIAETGVRLSGFSTSAIEALRPPAGVVAGDVHRPQRSGIVRYVGTPYQVRFGDDFEPRCLWLTDEGKYKNLHFECLRKLSLTIRGPEDLRHHSGLAPGDQVKLTIELAREEAVEAQNIRKAVLATCRDLQLEVFGTDLKVNSVTRKKRLRIGEAEELNKPSDIFNAFCKTEGVAANIRQAGLSILR